jgi:hypothetical protein
VENLLGEIYVSAASIHRCEFTFYLSLRACITLSFNNRKSKNNEKAPEAFGFSIKSFATIPCSPA